MFPTTAIVLLTGSLALCAPQGETTGQAGTTRPGLPAALRLEVGLGYDLFTHSYRVLSADTSTTLSEGSSMLNVVWSPWRDLGRQLELGNRFYASREYLHNVVSGYWSSIAGGLAWAADARWEAKRFQDGTLTYANDHDALQAALRGSWRWDRRWGVRGSLQADSFTYDRRSEFFYDTRTWSAEAAFGGGGWFGPWWELDGRGGTTRPEGPVPTGLPSEWNFMGDCAPSSAGGDGSIYIWTAPLTPSRPWSTTMPGNCAWPPAPPGTRRRRPRCGWAWGWPIAPPEASPTPPTWTSSASPGSWMPGPSPFSSWRPRSTPAAVSG
jgi:hypothetical protein